MDHLLIDRLGTEKISSIAWTKEGLCNLIFGITEGRKAGGGLQKPGREEGVRP